MGFGTSNANMQAALAMDPATLVDVLVDQAMNLAPTPAPAWGYWDVSDYANVSVEGPQQVLDW